MFVFHIIINISIIKKKNKNNKLFVLYDIYRGEN